jgi:hypothetical protein
VSSCAAKKFTQLVRSFYRVLEPSFAFYEQAARLQNRSRDFRFALTVAVTQFFVPKSIPKVGMRELGQRKRAASRQTKRARTVARQWPDSPEIREAAHQEYDRAFAEWFTVQRRQDELRAELPRRGRPQLEAARALVCSLASIYSASTGRAATIVTNPGHECEHTGPFADLLRALDKDMRLLIDRLDPALIKDWPTSLPRVAKNLRSKNTRTSERQLLGC